MTILISLLISLLGYGTPVEFENMSEAELNHEIEMNSTYQADGGVLGGWDSE